jgi:dTDP-4-dehydrorhamnose reductase
VSLLNRSMQPLPCSASRPLPADAIPLPLLITGIAGVAGYNALDYFRSKYPGEVIGIRQRDNWRMTGEGITACNAEDRDALARLFDEHAFRSVLDCAGNCDLKACELDPQLARRINVEGVANLLDVIGMAQVRLVHLSVDLVFSGTRGGGHIETDWTDPVTMYGKTMVASEELLAARYPQACTLRISLPMGISFNGHAGAIDWIQSRFKKFKPATLYLDEFRTPTYTDCLSEVCEVMLGNQLTGLFHTGAPRRLSLYQVGQVVNRIGGYAPEHLMGCPRVQAGPMPPRAGDVSMDSSKLVAALGYQPFDSWPYDDDLVPSHPHWHRERRPGERGSIEFLSEVLYRNPLRRRRSA